MWVSAGRSFNQELTSIVYFAPHNLIFFFQQIAAYKAMGVQNVIL